MIVACFPTLLKSIYLEDFSQEKEFLISKSLELYNRFVGSPTSWRCTTFNTLNLYSIKDDIIFKNLIERIKQEVLIFSKHFGVSTEILETRDAWINVARKHDYQEYHIHTDSHFSAVFYIQVPQNSGNLIFRSFEADTDMFPLPAKSLTEANFKTMSICPEENKLIIFRSNIKHMVESNANDDFRISLSLNFKFHDSK